MTFMTVASLLETVSAALSISAYLATYAFRAFRTADAPKALRGRRKSAKWLRFVQLVALIIVFFLSAAHVAMLYRISTERRPTIATERPDESVVYPLFALLLWLVLLLDFLNSSTDGGFEQLNPWMISTAFYTVSSILSSIYVDHDNNLRADIAIQYGRVAVLLLLTVTTLVYGSQMVDLEGSCFLGPIADQEENQPLIDGEEGGGIVAYGENQQPMTSDADSDSEEDADEEREGHTELRNRKWWHYVSSFKVFIPFVRPTQQQQYLLLAAITTITAAERVVNLAQPLLLGVVVADLSNHSFHWPKVVAYVVLTFATSNSGIALIQSLVSYKLTLQMEMRLTYHCYEHVMGLSASYHLSKSSPDVWQMLNRGYSVIELLNTITFTMLPIIIDLVIALIVVNRLFGPYLCFVVATTMIVFIWANRVTLEQKTKRRRKFIEIWRKQYRHMSETFMHWKTVSEFNKISYENGRQKDLNSAATRLQLSNYAFRMSLEAAQEAAVTVGFLFVCFFAAKSIAESSDGDNVGKFVTLVTYWSQIMGPMTTLAGSTSDITDKLVDAEKLVMLLEKKPTVVESSDAQPFVFAGGAITFDQVSFSYDGERDVTKGLSFAVKPGQTVAFVGETGGGKSTIFNLLYRLYDPRSGRILVDGQDIKHLQIESYRSALGLVPQNPVVFNVSVMENVRYSNQSATDAEVIAACKAAELHEKIMKFPKRYQQKVGELAQKLSGGELQRLAIARAILKDPKILLLDEATSSVDSITERKIQQKIDLLASGRTTFIIAHRLSTTKNADVIAVVKEGQIVEVGKHNDLLTKENGAYRELWEAQVKVQGGFQNNGACEEAETIQEPLIDMGSGKDLLIDDLVVDKEKLEDEGFKDDLTD